MKNRANRQTVMPLRVWVFVRLLALAPVLIFDGCATQAPRASTSTPATFAALQPSSVALLSAQDGWVVSGSGSRVPPAYELHLQHGVWTREPLDDSADGLSKVVLLSPTDGWAVGGEHVYHYDGTRWTPVYSAHRTAQPFLDLRDVAFLSPTEGWAVGTGGILHYHDGQWTDVSASLPQMPTPTQGQLYTGPHLRALALVSATEGWAVGNLGVIWRYNGTAWQPAPAPNIGTPYQFSALFDIALTSAGDGWAVGRKRGVATPDCFREPAVIERLTRGQWALAVSLPGELDGAAGQPTLRALAMQSPTQGWVAGALIHRTTGKGEAAGYVCTAASYMLRLSGGQWTPVPVPNVGTINGLAFDSPDDGWAAADGGLLHYHDGTWSSVLM